MTGTVTETGCRACRLGWEHCHGTLVEQPDGSQVCSEDADCSLPPAAHEHVEPADGRRR